MLRGLQELPASRRSIPTLYPAGQRVFRAQRCKTLGGDYLARQVGFEESENHVYYELGGSAMPGLEPRWEAHFEHGSLHVSGSAIKYPNDFSTASLARQPDDPAHPDVLIYHVVFHRDKEPFCDADLVGPVHYFEQVIPRGKRRIRVIAAEGAFEFPIPDAAA